MKYHLFLAHTYWKKHLRPGDYAIDATAGNGCDTLELVKIPLIQVISLDIQQVALEKTKRALPQEFLPRVSLHSLCHSKLDLLPLLAPPRLIVYNLGYLPGGDKSITTETSTTLQSLHKAVNLLAEDGALSITCYPGHSEGEREEKAILEWAGALSSSSWQVCHHRWVNRPRSPSLLWMTRLASSMM
jgi:hypothetical protein